jgi:NADPH-dependent 2,4-dienoyl-CoA reductase/sulfur reductase-like enzyme
MPVNAGLWVDHRKAVIATLVGETVALTRVESKVGSRVRYQGVPHEKGEDQRDRRFTGHLNRYYDKVIDALSGADSVLILGPGEAKGELADRLRKTGRGNRIVAIEAADKMTGPQLAARVQSQFGPK